MGSKSDSGKINLSDSAYQYLKNNSFLTFESKGKIGVKGKGDLEMFFVCRIK
jgi:hypothetical protein